MPAKFLLHAILFCSIYHNQPNSMRIYEGILELGGLPIRSITCHGLLFKVEWIPL